MAVRTFDLLDLDAVRVVRADLVQRQDVSDDQEDQRERQCDDVQREEAVQRDVGDVVVAADPFDQRLADARNRAEQRHDHLRAPVRHVAPGQQVAEEGFRHQAQVDQHAEDPHQLARVLVRAVHQAAEHVQVDDDEERRRAGRVHVADQPAPLDVAHDVLDRRERVRGRGLVAHRQEDAGDDLQDQHDHREHAEVVPEVEVLRRVVLARVLLPHARHREALVDPVDQRAESRALARLRARHCGAHQLTSESTPICTRPSLMKRYGGTLRLSGAGTSLKTRPERSNFEPWQGQ